MFSKDITQYRDRRSICESRYPDWYRRGYQFYGNTPNKVANLAKYQTAAQNIGVQIEFVLPAYAENGRIVEDLCAILVFGDFSGLSEARVKAGDRPGAFGLDVFD